MVNATDPAELEKIKDRELGIARERVQMVLDAGANVILTTKVGVRVLGFLQLRVDIESGCAGNRRYSAQVLCRPRGYGCPAVQEGGSQAHRTRNRRTTR